MELILYQCVIGHWPAAVVTGIPLQGASSTGQAHTGEGMVVCELCVRQAAQAVWLIEDVLPVGAQAWRALWQAPEQEGVQLVDNLLVDASLKLTGEEGRPCGLLQKEMNNEKKQAEKDYGLFCLNISIVYYNLMHWLNLICDRKQESEREIKKEAGCCVSEVRETF